MVRLYYTPPSDMIFHEIKTKAIELWQTYDNEFGYVDEKLGTIKNITNLRDNFMYIVAMFDMQNQRKLADMLSEKAKEAVRKRMVDGGQPLEYNVF